MADFFGFNFPFLTETTVLPPQADERLIKNDLKQLLLTSFGERVMRPDYGTPIRKTPMEPGDESTLIILASEIKRAITRFEPRVLFRDVQFVQRPDDNYLEIMVYAALTRDPNVILSVEVTVNPDQGSSQPLQGL